jgi:hypothetical protein
MSIHGPKMVKHGDSTMDKNGEIFAWKLTIKHVPYKNHRHFNGNSWGSNGISIGFQGHINSGE